MQVQCPSCSSIVTLPDDRAGQVVSCPKCGAQMQLPAGRGAPAMAPVRTPGLGPSPDSASASPFAAGRGPTKACPYCGEEILAVAQKCRHCSSMLTGPNAGPGGARSASQGMTDGLKAVIFGGLGFVVCGLLGPFAIYFGSKARRDPSDRLLGNIGLALGIIGVLIAIVQVIAIVAMIASNA